MKKKLEFGEVENCKICEKKGIIIYPKLVNIEGLYYLQCKKCNFEPYDCLGIKIETAVKIWNKKNK